MSNLHDADNQPDHGFLHAALAEESAASETRHDEEGIGAVDWHIGPISDLVDDVDEEPEVVASDVAPGFVVYAPTPASITGRTGSMCPAPTARAAWMRTPDPTVGGLVDVAPDTLPGLTGPAVEVVDVTDGGWPAPQLGWPDRVVLATTARPGPIGAATQLVQEWASGALPDLELVALVVIHDGRPAPRALRHQIRALSGAVPAVLQVPVGRGAARAVRRSDDDDGAALQSATTAATQLSDLLDAVPATTARRNH